MNICGKDKCKIFIQKILPYLKYKNDRASLILKFFEGNSTVSHRRAGIPKEIIEFREEIYQQMRKLNA